MTDQTRDDLPVVRDHRRQWRNCLYVYPVISRRARGLSIGVNINPDKTCNFSCLYCQIDRRARRNLDTVDIPTLAAELGQAMRAAQNGDLWREPRFAEVPPELRKINDIAFSGDGEPTCLPNFDQAVAAATQVKRRFGRDDVRIVVITNASRLDESQVARALPLLDANNGQIWAKLDAGSEEYFRQVNRPAGDITLHKVLDNIIAVARSRPVVIQSLFFRIAGQAPPAAEIDAYCARLREITAAGGRIELVQVHTIARPPQDPAASSLPDWALDAVAAKVRQAAPGLRVETYYGHDVPPQQQL